MTERGKGLLHGALAYGLWGVVPVYWNQLADVDAVELTAHRVIWGLTAFGVLVVIARQTTALRIAVRDRRVVALMAFSALLLGFNWGLFVWATTRGHLLEASLGYFMNPLISVAIGTLWLRERPSRMQWIAIGLAAIGVGVLTWRAGRLPYVALALAVSFGIYGLVRKLARVDAIAGSTIETALLLPIAAVYMISHGGGTLGRDAPTTLLLVGTGIVTAIPLVLFTSAARRLPLSTLGLLQYLGPSGQFLLAVLAYGEPLARERLVAFALTWIGLAVFSIDLWRRTRRAA